MLKKTFFVAVVAVLVSAVGLLLGCGGGDENNPGNNSGGTPNVTTGTFKDNRDGQTYKTVKVGNQTWMAQNMNFLPDTMKVWGERYWGDDGVEHADFTDSSWCYNNNESNCVKYGRLYSWYGALDACPTGWRLPTWGDWYELRNIVTGGGYGVGSIIGGKKLKSKTEWNENGNGTDEIGFSAMPGGSHSSNRPIFNAIGNYGYWWATDQAPDPYKEFWYAKMSYDDDELDIDTYGSSSGHTTGAIGYSVRCIKK